MNMATQTPLTDDMSIEQMIQTRGKTAPRVTPADIDAAIVSEHFWSPTSYQVGCGHNVGPVDLDKIRLLTFCILTLRNGFTVTGESACASPENFDPEICRKIGRQNAVQKIWPLMGYALKERLQHTAA